MRNNQENSRKEVFLQQMGRLVPMALAFGCLHGLLRVLLLFRLDPFGVAFVNKPDWYIFHALSLDYMWIGESLALAGFMVWIMGKWPRWARAVVPAFAALHGVLLYITLLDHEIQRFLGMHISWTLLDTYKDTSSVRMFTDYVSMDQSIPYLQYFLLILFIPFALGLFRVFRRWLAPHWPQKAGRQLMLAVGIYILCWLFIHVIWTGGARLRKLAPVVQVVAQEWQTMRQSGGDTTGLNLDVAFYQQAWQQVQGDSQWVFPLDSLPLWRIPIQENPKQKAQRALQPNIIVVFLESQRGWDVGFLNGSKGQTSCTPFLDSLAQEGAVWTRLHTSGLPTTGGLLSSHMGVPPHSRLNSVTQLAHIHAPSFASILQDSGYVGHFFAAADPAWDNLGVWLGRWYHRVHYNRLREDDSTFWAYNARYLMDSVATAGKPFYAAMITRSNHYPFNFAPGMPAHEKDKAVQERIRYTMRYADHHLGLFYRQIAQQPWFQNTYVIVMADHGFPLGENGVTTMSGGAFSSVTWIPLVIHGPGIPKGWVQTVAASQIDVAPTILGLAGLSVGVPFMGHDLLRGSDQGWALGAHYGFGTLGDGAFRYLASLNGQHPDFLYEHGDIHQKNNLMSTQSQRADSLGVALRRLLRVSDYTQEKDLLSP